MHRVLIVNDSKFEAIVMKDILSKLGCNVKIASELDVVKEVKLFLPKFIFVNYIMERTRGDLLIYNIKTQYPDIICILTSSNILELKNFKGKNVDEIINTPKDLQQLDKILKDLNDKSEEVEAHKSEDDIISDAIRKRNIEHIQKEEPAKEFCPFCGQKLEKILDKKCLFCPYCGSRLSEANRADSV